MLEKWNSVLELDSKRNITKGSAEELRKAFNLLKDNDCIPTEIIEMWIGQRMYNKLNAMLQKKKG